MRKVHNQKSIEENLSVMWGVVDFFNEGEGSKTGCIPQRKLEQIKQYVTSREILGSYHHVKKRIIRELDEELADATIDIRLTKTPIPQDFYDLKGCSWVGPIPHAVFPMYHEPEIFVQNVGESQ